MIEPLRIWISGGSGFVGRHVIDSLLGSGHAVVALVNNDSIPVRDGLTSIRGSLFDANELAQTMTGCSAVVHLVGIIEEHPRRGATFEHLHVDATRCVVKAAGASQIGRYLHMSALGSRPNAVSRYHQTKYEAEQIVRGSTLDWTIFRPSLIHGTGGEFTEQERRWAQGKALPWFFMPYFGKGLLGFSGSGRIQPISVKDVATIFAQALRQPETVGKVFDLVGADVLDWPAMHRTFAEHFVGKRRARIGIPAWWAKTLAQVGAGKMLGFNKDQVIMSQEDVTADIAPLVQTFGFTPAGLKAALRSE